jgi:hypothetical protein
MAKKAKSEKTVKTTRKIVMILAESCEIDGFIA